MGMVADVIFAIAVVAIAAGTVAEFQIGVGYVGPSADRAAVGVWCLGCSDTCLIGTGIGELDDFCFLAAAGFGLTLAEKPAGIGTPGHGNYVQHILTEEQEIVGKGNDGEQIGGEGTGEQIREYEYKIKQGKDPCFDGDNIKQQKMGIGIHGGISQEQACIQIGDICISAKNQTVNVHHHDSGKIKQIELQGTPDVFHSPAKGIVAEEGNGNQNQIVAAGTVYQGVGEQPPDLSLKDMLSAEEQQIGNTVISGHCTGQVDNGGANNDI